jgi:hypothetical protein
MDPLFRYFRTMRIVSMPLRCDGIRGLSNSRVPHAYRLEIFDGIDGDTVPVPWSPVARYSLAGACTGSRRKAGVDTGYRMPSVGVSPGSSRQCQPWRRRRCAAFARRRRPSGNRAGYDIADDGLMRDFQRQRPSPDGRAARITQSTAKFHLTLPVNFIKNTHG